MKHNTTQHNNLHEHTQGVSNIYETHLRRKLQTVELWRQRQSLMGTLSQKPRSPSVWGSEEHPKIENEDEDFHEDKNYEDDDLKVGALTVTESRHFQKDGDTCIMHLTLTIEVITGIKIYQTWHQDSLFPKYSLPKDWNFTSEVINNYLRGNLNDSIKEWKKCYVVIVW